MNREGTVKVASDGHDDLMEVMIASLQGLGLNDGEQNRNIGAPTGNNAVDSGTQTGMPPDDATQEDLINFYLGQLPGIEAWLATVPNETGDVDVDSSDVQELIKAVVCIRKLTSVEENPPLNDVNDSGVVSHLIRLFGWSSVPSLQFEAAWAVTNVASGTHELTMVATEHGAIEGFVYLLGSGSPEVAEQAMWGLGNIAGDCDELRDRVIDAGGMAGVLSLLSVVLAMDYSPGSTLLSNGIWTLSNMVRGKRDPPISDEDLQNAMDALAFFAFEWEHRSPHMETMMDGVWGLAYISKRKPEAVVQYVPQLIETLRRIDFEPSMHASVFQASCVALSEVLAADGIGACQIACKAGIIPLLQEYLEMPHAAGGVMSDKRQRTSKGSAEALFMLSNLLADSVEIVEMVAGAGLWRTLVRLLHDMVHFNAENGTMVPNDAFSHKEIDEGFFCFVNGLSVASENSCALMLLSDDVSSEFRAIYLFFAMVKSVPFIGKIDQVLTEAAAWMQDDVETQDLVKNLLQADEPAFQSLRGEASAEEFLEQIQAALASLHPGRLDKAGKGAQVQQQKGRKTTNQATSNASAGRAAPDEGTLANAISAVQNLDGPDTVEAIVAIRKALSVESMPPIQEIIDSGVIPKIIDVASAAFSELEANSANIDMETSAQVNLLFEVLWLLTNVASGSSEQTAAVVSAGAMKMFCVIGLVPSRKLQEQAVWGLGNIVGDSATMRDYAIECGGLEVPLSIIENTDPAEYGSSIFNNAVWALSNFTRGKPPPTFSDAVLRRIINAASHALFNGSSDAQTDALWLLSYITEVQHSVQCVLDSGVGHLLVQQLAGSPQVATPALRTVGNILTGNDAQAQAIINMGVLAQFVTLLHHPKRMIRKESLWAISNITAGTPDQIQSILDHNLLPQIVESLRGDEREVKREALWALTNLVSGGTPNQISAVVDAGAIQILGSILQDSAQDTKLLAVALEGLSSIFTTIASSGNDPQSFMSDEIMEALERLQSHQNQHVYQQCASLLEHFETSD